MKNIDWNQSSVFGGIGKQEYLTPPKPEEKQERPISKLSDFEVSAEEPPPFKESKEPMEKDFCAYLKTKIGAEIRGEFLVGAFQLVEKRGKLAGVGEDYLLLEQREETLLCDLNSIKFISFQGK